MYRHTQRRAFAMGLLGYAVWLPVAAQTATQSPEPASPPSLLGAAKALRQGGAVLLIRHAQTEPGVGDPPGWRLNACATQRNLNQQGVAQAKQIGQWFKREQLTPRAVKTSQWCRTRDTARLAFGKHSDWPALNSFFETRERESAQTVQLRAALKDLPQEGFEVWVAHGVNILALTGQSPAPAEGFVVNTSGTIIARTLFE
jgi:phosphohistidine phosphatase SixA